MEGGDNPHVNNHTGHLNVSHITCQRLCLGHRASKSYVSLLETRTGRHVQPYSTDGRAVALPRASGSRHPRCCGGNIRATRSCVPGRPATETKVPRDTVHHEQRFLSTCIKKCCIALILGLCEPLQGDTQEQHLSSLNCS